MTQMICGYKIIRVKIFLAAIIFLVFNPSFVLSEGMDNLSAPSNPAGESVANKSAKVLEVSEHQNESGDLKAAIDSQTLVRLSWEASGKNDLEKVLELTSQCDQLYSEQAKKEQSSLIGFPERGKEKEYQVLNDVATCLFIRAEALMNNGKAGDAQIVFHQIIESFPWSQSWDPSRGAFWSVAEKSQSSIDVLIGKVQEEEEEKIQLANQNRTTIKLYSPGKENVIDYSKYGKFVDVGTKDYHYDVTDPKGLSSAIGEGIYPNTGDILKDPLYKEIQKEGRLEGDHWGFVYSSDLQAAFYKWATAPEPWGIKLFYLGLIFEKAHMYYEAIKAYHAIVVHFPQTIGWTYWQTPWYPAQAAIAKIKFIIRQHPELNLKIQWAKVQVINGFDNDISNDINITFPGKISRKSWWDLVMNKFPIDQWSKQFGKMGKIKKSLGSGTVRLVQYTDDHWQMLVDNKPYLIKGITYHPTKIGQSPDKGTLSDWMTEDSDHNGKIDGPYDAWVDANGNNEQDPQEPSVGDFQLMKEMGVNTIRQYHQPFELNKKLLRDMYEHHGIRVIIGDFLGKYTLGSGATWYPGTDYENPEHRKNMMASVQKMVMEYKDEPYVLLWLLGNENNYGVASNADSKPSAYFEFVNEVAKWIKSVDKNHPVALCSGDTLYLDLFAKNSPDVDLYGANLYRGDYGFGSFWEQISDATGKPAFVTEYGCPAYARHLSLEESEEAQARYHEGNWRDIEKNSAGHSEGIGNAVGGVAFEWLDEWWKNYEPFYHDRKSDAIGPFPGGYYYEEWFGLCSQGKGRKSPFLRQLRPSYFTYKKLWNSTKN